MDKEALECIVHKELEIAHLYKNELKESIVSFDQKECETMDGNSEQIWIVAKKNDYYIAYCERTKKFGLAFNNIVNQSVYLGDDGSLEDAYDNIISREEDTESGSSDQAKNYGKRNKRSFKPKEKQGGEQGKAGFIKRKGKVSFGRKSGR
jgi:hypothetical protein